MAVAAVTAKRARCHRAQVGAVVVSSDERVLSTGYNGEPAGYDGPACPRYDGAPKSSCIAIHAEANALLYSDWTARQGGTLYVTRTPCMECAKLIANSGLARVVFRVTDDDQHVEEVERFLMRTRTVPVRFLEEE